jgi:hypothetical protein
MRVSGQRQPNVPLSPLQYHPSLSIYEVLLQRVFEEFQVCENNRTSQTKAAV